MRGKGIARMYINGGAKFLAYRMGHIFTKIETEEQRILHNDVLAELLDIINKEQPRADTLLQTELNMLRAISEFVLYKKIDRKKRFLFWLAKWIIDLGQLK